MHNYIMPVSLVLGILFVSFLTLRGKARYSRCNTDKKYPLRDCPQDFLLRNRLWFVLTNWWMFVNYIILIFGFLSSMLVLYINSTAATSKTETIIYSIIAAAMTIIGYVVSPKKHMQAYRKAASKLDSEICSYMYVNESDDVKPLVEAVNYGEKCIDETLS